jgi:hypothetical protein
MNGSVPNKLSMLPSILNQNVEPANFALQHAYQQLCAGDFFPGFRKFSLKGESIRKAEFASM